MEALRENVLLLYRKENLKRQLYRKLQSERDALEKLLKKKHTHAHTHVNGHGEVDEETRRVVNDKESETDEREIAMLPVEAALKDSADRSKRNIQKLNQLIQDMLMQTIELKQDFHSQNHHLVSDDTHDVKLTLQEEHDKFQDESDQIQVHLDLAKNLPKGFPVFNPPPFKVRLPRLPPDFGEKEMDMVIEKAKELNQKLGPKNKKGEAIELPLMKKHNATDEKPAVTGDQTPATDHENEVHHESVQEKIDHMKEQAREKWSEMIDKFKREGLLILIYAGLMVGLKYALSEEVYNRMSPCLAIAYGFVLHVSLLIRKLLQLQAMLISAVEDALQRLKVELRKIHAMGKIIIDKAKAFIDERVIQVKAILAEGQSVMNQLETFGLHLPSTDPIAELIDEYKAKLDSIFESIDQWEQNLPKTLPPFLTDYIKFWWRFLGSLVIIVSICVAGYCALLYFYIPTALLDVKWSAVASAVSWIIPIVLSVLRHIAMSRPKMVMRVNVEITKIEITVNKKIQSTVQTAYDDIIGNRLKSLKEQVDKVEQVLEQIRKYVDIDGLVNKFSAAQSLLPDGLNGLNGQLPSMSNGLNAPMDSLKDQMHMPNMPNMQTPQLSMVGINPLGSDSSGLLSHQKSAVGDVIKPKAHLMKDSPSRYANVAAKMPIPCSSHSSSHRPNIPSGPHKRTNDQSNSTGSSFLPQFINPLGSSTNQVPAHGKDTNGASTSFFGIGL
eukprot:GILJ01005976.1.p1 GENE.GILJ01005976.1~~GILJ01005976.1.p1  ORF type:complete len:725 (+),score=137.77 GILJ01005976.1:46-2220(+)